MPHCAITQTKPLHSSRRPGRAEVAIKQSTKYQSCNKQTKWTKKSSIYHLLSWAHSISVKTPWAANWPDFCCHKRKGWCWLTMWWNQVKKHLNWFNHKFNDFKPQWREFGLEIAIFGSSGKWRCKWSLIPQIIPSINSCHPPMCHTTYQDMFFSWRKNLKK